MALLLMDENFKKELERIRLYAEAHPMTAADLILLKQGLQKPPGDTPHFSCLLPVGFRVVYTVEKVGGASTKHVSVSCDRPGKHPNPGVVEQIMKELGFTKDMSECRIYVEEEVGAINVVEINKG